MKIINKQIMQLVLDLGAHKLEGLKILLNQKIVKEDSIVFSLEANPFIFSDVLESNICEELNMKYPNLMLNYLNLAVSKKSGFEKINCGAITFKPSYFFVNSLSNSIKKLGQSIDLFKNYARYKLKAKLHVGQHSNILKNPPTKFLEVDDSNYIQKIIPSISLKDLINEALKKIKISSSIHLTIKIDIEGAEYQVLEEFIKTYDEFKKFKRINFFVEWHEGYYENKSETMQKKEKIKSFLQKIPNVVINDWM